MGNSGLSGASLTFEWNPVYEFAAEAFSSAEAFLASDVVSETRCLLLDIVMPGMSGSDLRQELMHRRHRIPIVFITASGDRTIRPRLLAHRGQVMRKMKADSRSHTLVSIDTIV